MTHACHAHDCAVTVPPRMLMCARHWRVLRKPMQDAIWREYRAGQERTKTPSLRYLAVQARAVGEVAFRPHDEAAAANAAPYLLRAEVLRAQCITSGVGDPLDGLSKATVPDAVRCDWCGNIVDRAHGVAQWHEETPEVEEFACDACVGRKPVLS